MSLEELQLPIDYLQWLAKLPLHHLGKFKKNDWQFAAVAELTETIKINRVKVTYARQLQGWVAMYEGMGGDAADGPKGTQFSFDRLRQCLVLATDNEEMLFVDPADLFSAWKLEPEECTIQVVAKSLADLIAKVVVEDLDAD